MYREVKKEILGKGRKEKVKRGTRQERKGIRERNKGRLKCFKGDQEKVLRKVRKRCQNRREKFGREVEEFEDTSEVKAFRQVKKTEAQRQTDHYRKRESGLKRR